MKSKIDRPNFSVTITGELDKKLREVSEFAGRVTAFGDADGFFKIKPIVGPGWNQDMSDGWKHDPPYFYEFISTQGQIYPYEYVAKIQDQDSDRKHKLFKQLEEEDKKNGTNKLSEAIRSQDPRLVTSVEDDNTLYWIIDARATLVSVDSYYKVRTGFHTRIISACFDLAFQRTVELWEEESAKEDWEKNDIDQEGYNPNAYKIARCMEFNANTLGPIAKELEELDSEFKFRKHSFNPDTLTVRQYWQLFRTIKNIKEDIKIVEDALGDKIYDQRFIDFENQEDEIDRLESEKDKGKKFFSGDEVFGKLNKRSERYSEFFKSVGIEDDDEY